MDSGRCHCQKILGFSLIYNSLWEILLQQTPFEITSAPKHFQQRMNDILQDLARVVCHVDDILVSGKDKEHDSHLHAVLKKLEAEGVTLNKEKCQFACTRIVFLGHVIDANEIFPDPNKTEVIQKMKSPTNFRELSMC